MDSHQKTIDAFVQLGNLFNTYSASDNHNEGWLKKLDNALVIASNRNKWFTKENLRFCIDSWGKTLTEKHISEWLDAYPVQPKRQRLGLVLAGNIPLVGLHDLLCGLACGYEIEVKCSSNDAILLPFILDFLTDVEHQWKGKVHFTDGKLTHFDRVIATGSSNTARYFEYYFRHVPHIVRQTRNGVAILDGSETEDDLAALCVDMLQYFGLGCRSVSHLIVPEGYSFDALFLALYKHKDIIYHNAYANNYDYNKAVYLMQEQDLLDNGFILLKKDSSLHSPIACMHYSTYETVEQALSILNEKKESIQCVVSKNIENTLVFGQTQYPKLTDYADYIDTMHFLLKK